MHSKCRIIGAMVVQSKQIIHFSCEIVMQKHWFINESNCPDDVNILHVQCQSPSFSMSLVCLMSCSLDVGLMTFIITSD